MKIKLTIYAFVGPLFLTFLILKLCHVIAWSWAWVLSPLWIGLALWIVSNVIFEAIKHKLGF